MAQFNCGHFEADGSDINLPIGFVPDYFELMDFHTSTNIVFYKWWKRMEGDMGTGLQEGVSVTEGATARLADSGGITEYDSSSIPTINRYTVARSTAATARSATADGTLIMPSTSSTTDPGAIFECVTAGTGSAEPTWPTDIGGQVTDGTVVWERVNASRFRAGYKGVTIVAALMTDGREYFWNAWKADESYDNGDVDGWPSGVYTPGQVL